jgi:hypothetical protein
MTQLDLAQNMVWWWVLLQVKRFPWIPTWGCVDSPYQSVCEWIEFLVVSRILINRRISSDICMYCMCLPSLRFEFFTWRVSSMNNRDVFRMLQSYIARSTQEYFRW